MEGEKTLESFPLAQDSKGTRIKGAVRLILRFWYVIVVVVLALGVVIFFLLRAANTDEAWKRASDYFSRADYEKAAQELNGLGVPQDAERLTVYSQTMLATRQLDKALVGYSKLYDLKKDPAVKLIIGNIYNEQKNYGEAEKIYAEAISSNPSYIQAYVNLATLHRMQGKTEEAIAVAKRGVENNTRNVTLNELLVSMLLDRKDSPEYAQAVAALAEINPNDPLLESLGQ